MASTRRELVSMVLGAAAAALVPLHFTRAAWAASLRQRAVPATGEPIPVIGMGTSGSFDVGASAQARAPLREVLQAFVDGGASLIDTAPTYGRAEDVLGDLMAQMGIRDRIFLATKLSGVTGREAGMRQFEHSLQRLHTDRIELLQVHNLRDWRTQLDLARALRQMGKLRYVGLTHYLDSAHDELAEAMAEGQPDFIQINYSVASRNAEQRLLPMAQDQGVAVIINRAYEDGRIFARVRDKELPGWASEVGAQSWGQLFLKFVLSHPAVTVVIPATSKPDHQRDNLQAGHGPLLDEAQREALAALVG
ncbi:MAG TPA: aldo/keto reductase [Xanthomonadaceae bacterium]|nr:aldo/keto reductase [Xanthomonadaceae bacterium]